MTNLLFHSAPAAARDLSERLEGLLGKLPPDDGARLLSLLVVDHHERPQLVLTGQYSSGKSTLVKALTDEAAQVVIDSGVATDKVQTFNWDGLVDLVDTPGVQAGKPGHDQLAEQALRTADLVLFAVTVDLFDDRSVEHLRHITEDLRKAPQLLVVITKSRTIHAVEGVRDEAVRDALGSFAEQVPWIECDAKTYLDGRHEDDPIRSSRLIDVSRMVEVKEAINRIARERGNLARFRAPLQQVALVAGEALATLTEERDEEAVLTVLARQRSALTNRRGLLESAFERQSIEFRTACIHAVEELADIADSIDDSTNPDRAKIEVAIENLNEKLSTANQRYIDGLLANLNSHLADFTSEVREIEASPYARHLLTLEVQSDLEAQANLVDTGLVDNSGGEQRQAPVWGPRAAEHLKNFQKIWGAGEGVKQASGSAGHQIVYKVGKLAKWKFEPWQAVRWADTIGKSAKAGALILPVALEVYAVVSDERAEVRVTKKKLRRRNSLVGRVLTQCDEISRSTLVQVGTEVDAEFGAALHEIDEINESVRDNQTSRSDLSNELRLIQIEAQSMLDQLVVPSLEA